MQAGDRAPPPRPGNGPPLPLQELPRLAYLGIVLGYVPLFFYYRGLRSTRAQVATFAELVWPLSAVALNWVPFGLGLTVTQLVAGGVLLAITAQAASPASVGGHKPLSGGARASAV
ncbi:MAG: EamA family transporter [Candidatus Aenigmarchaeota archaeon]|nr:EamA family transporter [Candidatus Aenigmarchaeota archaeon]